MSILEGEQAETIAEALLDADVPFAMSLTRITVLPGPDPWTPGEEVTETFECLGFIETYSDLLQAGTLIQEGDRKAVILTTTLNTTPALTDLLIVDSRAYSIMSIGYDPARATIELRVR